MTATTAKRPSDAVVDGHANGNGRLPNGQFGKGNNFSRGCTTWAQRIAERREALSKAVTVEEVTALGRALYERAMAGDNYAARVLMPYICGKPLPPVDPDLLALERLRAGVDVVEVGQLADKVSVGYAVQHIENFQAKDAEGHRKLLQDEIARREVRLTSAEAEYVLRRTGCEDDED
jgi:hypothetical protein